MVLVENGFKCWQRTCLSGLQTEPENTIPKTNYDARYVNPIFKTTTQRKGLVKKKFKSHQTAKSNTMSDQQNQYNCSSTENFRFIKESFEAALISARLWNLIWVFYPLPTFEGQRKIRKLFPKQFKVLRSQFSLSGPRRKGWVTSSLPSALLPAHKIIPPGEAG